MGGEFVETELGQLLTFANGRTSPKRVDGRPYPVYGSNGIIGYANESNASANSIVIGRVGSYCGSLYFSKHKSWVTDNAIRASALGNNDPQFLFYLLSTLNLNRLRAGSGQPLLNQEILSRIQTSVPEPTEQRAIALILGTLDDKIELDWRMNETLGAIAQALFKSWFVDFDPVRAKSEGRDSKLTESIANPFPRSFEGSELGRIPKGWRVVRIGEICEVIDCLHSKKPERLEFGLPLLQLSNIRDDGLIDMEDSYFISEDDYRKWVSRMEAKPGDCVITNVGRVGAVAQMPAGKKAALGRNMTGIRCKPNFPHPTFLIECLVSDAMNDEIGTKIDSGTILDALNVRNIPKLRFICASDDILRKFEILMRPLRAQMEGNLANARTLGAVRNALLPKLTSCEIRMKDADKIVGAVA